MERGSWVIFLQGLQGREKGEGAQRAVRECWPSAYDARGGEINQNPERDYIILSCLQMSLKII